MHAAWMIGDSLSPSPGQWLVISGLIISAVFWLLLRRRARPLDGSPRQYRREIDSASGQAVHLQRQVQHLLAELENASNKITARMDVEFARLNQSISEAEQRIAVLQDLVNSANEQIDHSAVNPASPVRAAHGPIADPRYERIYALADRGMTCSEIARRLGQHQGEVELILNLRTTR